ncbi:MAG: VOC family protein [Actinomycetota bacterium]|nr:VOC family protein [Actinomycetota bacterium]
MDVRLDLVGIVTRDMRASLAFYRLLGLEVPERAEDEPHAEVTTPGGLRVAWDTTEPIRQIYSDYTAPAGGHTTALAVLLPTPAAVDEKYAELAALGHGRKEPWDAPWGQRYAVVANPDGNPVDLFAPV